MATLVVSTPYQKGGRSIMRAAFSDNLFLIPFTFVPSTSYVTGGDMIPTGSLPTGYKDLISPFAVTPNPYVWKLDVANSKLLAYGLPVAGSAEITGGTNLTTAAGSSAITIFFLAR